MYVFLKYLLEGSVVFSWQVLQVLHAYLLATYVNGLLRGRHAIHASTNVHTYTNKQIILYPHSVHFHA